MMCRYFGGRTTLQSGVSPQDAGSTNSSAAVSSAAGTLLPDGTRTVSDHGFSSDLINGSPDIAVQPVILCDPGKNLAANHFINGSCFGPPSPGHNGSNIFPYIKSPAYLNNDLSMFKNFNFSEQKKLQFRISAYNFLNHPITSFVNGDNNYNLTFDPSGKLSTARFGYADCKTGHRLIQLALKFYF